jgi:hypothetical protein
MDRSKKNNPRVLPMSWPVVDVVVLQGNIELLER